MSHIEFNPHAMAAKVLSAEHAETAAFIADARCMVTAKPSTFEMLAFVSLAIGGALVTFAAIWSVV